MSEDNQAVPVIEEVAPVVEGAQVAPVDPVETPVVEETHEEIIARITLERDEAVVRAEKSQKGLMKVKRKGQSRAEAISQELASTKAKLNEYTGAQEQPKYEPTEQDRQRNAEYIVRCEDLKKDKTYLALKTERAQAGINPFDENPLIDNVFAHRGINPKVALDILADVELCERLSETEDPYEVVELVALAKERSKNKKAKVETTTKATKPVNVPVKTPTQKTNNNAVSSKAKSQSTKDFVADYIANKK